MRALLVTAILLLAACGSKDDTVAKTPPLNVKLLDREVTLLAERAQPARLEVAVQNLEGGEMWARNAVQSFPMQSVFKAPLGAAVLAEVDAGRLSLDEVITIGDMDLSPQYSAIAAAWPGRTTYTVGELLDRAVSDSDNTAADVLMRRIGGPGVLNAWLVGKGLQGLRIDRYERELAMDALGLHSFRPAWRTATGLDQAWTAVPEADRRRAWDAVMEDPRDSATASAALGFLRMLDAGQLLSPASTKLLLKLMTDTPRGAARLKAGLPPGATLAHKPGSSGARFGVTAATNDIGIVTFRDGRKYAVVVFLSGSTADQKAQDAIVADAMRIIARAVD
ncbi:MAG TPA: class A beta-lactamase [Caulobacter sp.]|nr:class A beta-lactamase [Caulobacter sp.]